MKNKPLALGGISLLLIFAGIGIGWLSFASGTVLNEALAVMALCLIGALIAALGGAVAAVVELFRGTERKAPAIIGLIIDALLGLLLLTVGGMTLYFLFFVNPNNFRL